MKIERINDNQIRCTLTGQDLAERHLQLSELAYGNAKTKQLFHEMMQQASYELGFEFDDLPLMIEAIPLSGGSIILNVTKVEYPDEMDTRFSNFTDYGDYPDNSQMEEDSPTLEGADDMLDVIRKIGTALNNSADGSAEFIPLKETAANVTEQSSDITAETAADLVKLFSFHDMNHLVRLAHVLDGFYHGDNSLFLDVPEHVYYLLLRKSTHTAGEFNKVCNILSEYALQNHYVNSAEAYFSEHFKCVAAHDALQRLAQV